MTDNNAPPATSDERVKCATCGREPGLACRWHFTETIDDLRAQLAAATAALATTYEAIEALTAAGMGAPGKANCLINMVHEIIAERGAATARAAELERDVERKDGVLLQAVERFAKLDDDLDAERAKSAAIRSVLVEWRKVLIADRDGTPKGCASYQGYVDDIEAVDAALAPDAGRPLLDALAAKDAEIERLKARLWSEQTLVKKMSDEFSAARVGIMARFGELHEHLSLMVDYLHQEASDGDGIREEHHDGYVAAKSVLKRTAPDEPQWENAQIEIAELLRKASELPGLTATLDEYRHDPLRIAESVGAYHDADGHARQPGTADEILSFVGALAEKAARVEQQSAAACGRMRAEKAELRADLDRERAAHDATKRGRRNNDG